MKPGGGDALYDQVMESIWCRSKINLKIKMLFYTMSDNKIVKTIMNVATLTILAAGIGWIG